MCPLWLESLDFGPSVLKETDLVGVLERGLAGTPTWSVLVVGSPKDEWGRTGDDELELGLSWLPIIFAVRWRCKLEAER